MDLYRNMRIGQPDEASARARSCIDINQPSCRIWLECSVCGGDEIVPLWSLYISITA